MYHTYNDLPVGIKAPVVYRCSKVINLFGEYKSGLHSKTEENTSIIRRAQYNNRNT